MTPDPGRLYLSAPTITDGDVRAVVRAMESGWIAPAGPDLTAFESEMACFVGTSHAVGLSSGTAALHLGLKYLGVSAGDFVLVPTVTFAATAFAVTYLGAVPFLVDVDPLTGTMNCDLACEAVRQSRVSGGRVSAAIPVDLYGMPANYGALVPAFRDLEVPILEDAAEGLGASVGDRRVGSFGAAGVLSFNGNKILTTSGGGMLLTNDPKLARAVAKWASQSREPVPWYEHEEIGYNYRLSNLLAALGRSQLQRIDATVSHRRQVREWYREGLAGLEGVAIQGDCPWGQSNAWLSVASFDTDRYPRAPELIRLELESHNIESRPVWKPLHQQPVFRELPSLLDGVADDMFSRGLCLPSGPSMDLASVERVCDIIRSVLAT